MKIVCCVFLFSMCFVVNCEGDDDDGNCASARDEAREAMVAGNYIPQCNDDGTYMAFQCWNSVGRCWCSSKEGVVLRLEPEEPADCEENG